MCSNTVVQLYVLEARSLSEQFTINVIIILIYAITILLAVTFVCVCNGVCNTSPYIMSL